jgi:hypothetical protein
MNAQRCEYFAIMPREFEVNLPLFGIFRARSNEVAAIDASSEKITIPKARHSGSPLLDSSYPVDFYGLNLTGWKALCAQLPILRAKPLLMPWQSACAPIRATASLAFSVAWLVRLGQRYFCQPALPLSGSRGALCSRALRRTTTVSTILIEIIQPIVHRVRRL